MNKNPSDIRNIRAYLLTALYNASLTIDNYYSALVNHDFYGQDRSAGSKKPKTYDYSLCNPGFNDILVIGTAILSKKKLKDINGDICPFLDFLCKVFADNPAVEYLAQFAVDYSVCILC